MLEDAVAAAREGMDYNDDDVSNDNWSPQINLGTSVLIPESYVKDLNTRMSLYRRLGDIESADDIDGFAAELIDRFGEFPEEVNNLLEIISIKRLCRIAGLSQVDAGPKGAVLTFHNNAPPNVEDLMHWITSKAGTVKLRPDQKLSIIRQWDKPAQRVKGIKSIATELAKFSNRTE